MSSSHWTPAILEPIVIVRHVKVQYVASACVQHSRSFQLQLVGLGTDFLLSETNPAFSIIRAQRVNETQIVKNSEKSSVTKIDSTEYNPQFFSDDQVQPNKQQVSTMWGKQGAWANARCFAMWTNALLRSAQVTNSVCECIGRSSWWCGHMHSVRTHSSRIHKVLEDSCQQYSYVNIFCFGK